MWFTLSADAVVRYGTAPEVLTAPFDNFFCQFCCRAFSRVVLPATTYGAGPVLPLAHVVDSRSKTSHFRPLRAQRYPSPGIRRQKRADAGRATIAGDLK